MATRTTFICDACQSEGATPDPAHPLAWTRPPATWSKIDFSAGGQGKRELLACSPKCTGTLLRRLMREVGAPAPNASKRKPRKVPRAA
jgi:hypothetical protein